MKVGEVYALLGMDFSQFDKDERTAKQRTQTLGASLSGIIKNAFSFTLGMGFFQAIQQGFRASVGSALDFNVTMEQARIGFETMLGSASRAESLLSNLASFAERTPFEFSGLLDASKRMLALGFSADRIIPTLRAVGNAAAGLGAGQQGIDRIILALGQMQAKGKVTGEEMRQLTEAGIQAWDILAESMGKSTQEVMNLASRGLIPADRAVQALVEGMETRFPNMMAQMEDSWQGMTSTIREIWKMTLGEVTNSLFERAKEWLKGVRDTMVRFREAFRAGGLSYAIEQTFGARAAASVNIMIAALKGLWSVVSGVSRFIIRHWTTIRTVVLGAAWAFLAFKTINAVLNTTTWATNVLATVTKILRGEAVKTSLTTGFLARAIQTYNLQLHYASMAGIAHVGVLRTLSTALYSLWSALGPIGWAIMAITAALGVGTVVWSKYNQAVQSAAQKAQTDKMAQQQQEYMDAVTEAAKGTEAQADALKEIGKAASKNLQSFDEVHTLIEDMAATTLGGAMALDTGLATPAISEMTLPDLALDFDAAIAGAKAEMGGFWGWLKQSAIDAFGSVKQWGIDLWAGVKDRWLDFKDWCGGFWENLKTAGGQAWNTIKTDASNLWEGAKGAWGSFKDWATGHWESIKANASQTWQDVKTGAATGWANIKTTIATKWDEIRTGASNTWANIKTSASTAWQDLKANTSTAWGNIKNTISQHWNELRAEAPQTWETIKTSIESRWEALKASAPQKWEDIKTAITTRFESAKTTVLAAAQDLYDKVPKTWDEMRAAIADLKDKVVNAITGPFEAAKQTVLGIVDAAKNWGKNLIANIVDGIQAKFNAVKNAVSNVANTLKGWLGFGSPTEEGPGRYADRWAPNLMRMYAQGILANIGMVQSAVSEVVRSLTSIATVPAPVFAGMSEVSGGGRMTSLASDIAVALSQVRGMTGMASSRPIEVVIKIDSREMARALVPAINAENDRTGYSYRTVLRTT